MHEAAAGRVEVVAGAHVDEAADCRDSLVVDEQRQENKEDDPVDSEVGNGIAAGRCSDGYSEPSVEASSGSGFARWGL